MKSVIEENIKACKTIALRRVTALQELEKKFKHRSKTINSIKRYFKTKN